MVATANTEYNRTRATLQARVDAAAKAEREFTGCFKDPMAGFLTIISFGATCLMMDKLKNELNSVKRSLQGHLNNYVGDVGPHLSNLSNLANVATVLYAESDYTTRLIRGMETDLRSRASAF